ncbi:MAG: ATP-binding cassette domain-containing protein [Actinomycetota bacterium]
MTDQMQPGIRGIKVEGLVREFKGGIRAVDGIDLHVEPGEIYGFLGPNGAGKSTTVLMLTTLLPPSGGRARVGGFDIVTEAKSVRSVIGAALQEVALDPLLTGREHLRLQSALQGVPRKGRKERADELLERVGLAQAADRKVRGYSGGMKRKLDLALALVHRPSILFLDEPTTGLDIQSRTSLWDEVSRLAKQDGVTVFLTTQYLEEADVLADRVGIIDGGKIVAEGTPAALKAQIGRQRLEVSPLDAADLEQAARTLSRFGDLDGAGQGSISVHLNEGDGDVAKIIRSLDRAKIKIGNFELHQPSLDDVFLIKTGHSLEGDGGDPPAASSNASNNGQSGRSPGRQ